MNDNDLPSNNLPEGNEGNQPPKQDDVKPDKSSKTKEAKQDTVKQITNADVVNRMANRLSSGDKEILDPILKKYKNGNIISADYVSEIEDNILNEYTVALADKKANEKISAKEKAEIEAYNNEIAKLGLKPEDIDDKIKEAVRYEAIDEKDGELIKKSPKALKTMLDRTEYNKKRQGLLPQAKHSEPISDEDWRKLSHKIALNKATKEEREVFNNEWYRRNQNKQ